MLHRALVAAAIALATSASLVACSYSWELPFDAGVDGTIADATLGADAGLLTDASNADGSDAGTCKSNAECDAGELCAFSDFQCGRARPGTCRSIAQLQAQADAGSCGAPATGPGVTRYCGCDGVTYSAICAVLEAGVDFSLGGCGIDAGYTQCGYAFCATNFTYCVENASPSSPFGCTPWTGCSPKDCSAACHPEDVCSDGGSCSSDGGTFVTCGR